jgi:hypothetical protein
MKNIFRLLVICLVLVSCDDTESVTFDPINGQTGVGFNESAVDLSVPEGGITYELGVVSTTISTVERTFNISVDTEASSETLTSADYTLGTVVIPADSYEGTVDVTFNYGALEDFEEYTLVVNLDLPDGVAPLTKTSSVEFTFLREFDINTSVCADLQLKILLDNFGSETTFEITDDAGAVVLEGGPYSDGVAGSTQTINVSLTEGCYTFTISDSYGDGLFDGNVTGNYDLFCAAQTVVSYASGSGNFGSSESTDFCINE